MFDEHDKIETKYDKKLGISTSYHVCWCTHDKKYNNIIYYFLNFNYVTCFTLIYDMIKCNI
jgi:hypothetical protein